MSKDSDTITLLLKLDYPQKEKFVKMSPKATIAELKAECCKQLEVRDTDVDRHEFRGVVFGKNVFDICKSDKNTLKDEGILHKTMIHLSAPADIKPQPERKKKEDEDEDTQRDKYKGLKVDSLLKYLDGKLSTKDENLALEFFDIYISKICKSDEWLKLDKKKILNYVQRNRLNIREGELFESVVAWGKAECKRNSKDVNAENTRACISDIISHIRFPTMGMDEVATKVSPTYLLKSDEVLAIFTYLGSTEEKKKNIKMAFPTKPRDPRRPPNWFTWSDSYKHYSIQLKDKNTVAYTTDPNNWQNLGGSTELTKGTHEWEVVLNSYDTGNGNNVVIGVVPSSFSNWTYGSWIGSSTTVPGWAFICGSGYKANESSGSSSYGSKCVQGDVIKVKLNLTKNTLEFFINNKSQGTAFTNVYGPVRPAISLIRTQTCTLRMGLSVDDS
jgi:hypothetical protein